MRYFLAPKRFFLLLVALLIQCRTEPPPILPVFRLSLSVDHPQGERYQVESFRFSPDGMYLAVNLYGSTKDGNVVTNEIQIWDVNEQRLISKAAKLPTENFSQVFWNRESNGFLALEKTAGVVKFWKLDGTLDTTLSFNGSFELQQTPKASEDSSLLVFSANQTVNQNKSVLIHAIDTQKRQVLFSKDLRSDINIKLFATRNGQWIGFSSKNSSLTTLNVWETTDLVSNPNVLPRWEFYFPSSKEVLVLINGHDSSAPQVMVSSYIGIFNLQTIQADTNAVVQNISFPITPPYLVQVSAQDRQVVILSDPDQIDRDLFQRITIWDSETNALITKVVNPEAEFLFSAAGSIPNPERTFLVRKKYYHERGTYSVLPQIWDSSLNPLVSLVGKEPVTSTMIFSTDGTKAAAQAIYEDNAEIYVYYLKGI